MKELPRLCDIGCRKNSKGYKETWVGYKLHLMLGVIALFADQLLKLTT